MHVADRLLIPAPINSLCLDSGDIRPCFQSIFLRMSYLFTLYLLVFCAGRDLGLDVPKQKPITEPPSRTSPGVSL